MKIINKKLEIFFKNIKLHKHIYIGFSGGVDSAVLLHLSFKILSSNHILHVIHVNHSYNKDSYRWSVFCKNICDAYNIVLYTYTIKNKIYINNFEESFRISRFNFFLDCVKKNSSLLLAHNYDDFIETIIMKIFRGSGLNSLIGIRNKTSIGVLNVIRPLLSVKKIDILNYAFENKVLFINDYSNFNDKFLRNYVRHNIVSVLPSHWVASNVIFKNGVLLNNMANYFHFYSYFFLGTYAFNYKSLSIKYLKSLSIILINEVVRVWISFNNCKMPNFLQMNELIKLIYSGKNIGSCINIGNYSIFKIYNSLNLSKNFIYSDFKNLSFLYRDVFSLKVIILYHNYKVEIF